MLAPTDAAFAALPKVKLDALMADPKALADLVHNHVVEGYVPRSSLAKTPGGEFNRTFTNMLGTQITIGGEYSVNGINVGDMDSIFIANQALSAEYMAKNADKLEKKVYSVPEDIDKEIARLKLQAMGVKIDTLTPEQVKNLGSWEEGT